MRRDFLKALVGAGILACGHAPRRKDKTTAMSVDAFLASGPRTMWVAAHPDDECFSGTLLARSRFYYGNALCMVVLTHGEGGECCLEEGCKPDLATVRGQEMAKVAERYGAELIHEHFFNAPLPVETFPMRHEIYARWVQQKDPVDTVAQAIRRFKPDLLLTFSPVVGATGHPEHQLASRVATAAVRAAAEGAEPHRVARTYYVLNRYWPYVLLGKADPGPVTEQFDATLPCPGAGRCLDFMLEATRLHRTQARDMAAVRRFYGAFLTMNLRLTDPFREVYPPDEPAAHGGMG